tara:strand:- start:149 stop:463 length:315 start_codon:yes stop_codon:yes gene_type:complete
MTTPHACLAYKQLANRNIVLHECPYQNGDAVSKWLSDGVFSEGDLIIFHKWMSSPFDKGPAAAWNEFIVHKVNIKYRIFPNLQDWDTVVYRIDSVEPHYWQWSE